MRTALLIVATPLLALAACGRGSEGAAAYRDGRFADAHAAFVAAADEAGEDASFALLHNRALSALRAGEWRDAEASAARAAARAADAGDPDWTALASFLQGSAAFALCDLAAAQADTPEAEPFAFDVAIRYGEAARDHWRAAAASRGDWPEARRNVERALLELLDLARKKEDAARRNEPKSAPEPPPPPDPAESGKLTPEEAAIEQQLTDLSAGDVRRLYERLHGKDREKAAVRRAARAARAAEVDRDW